MREEKTDKEGDIVASKPVAKKPVAKKVNPKLLEWEESKTPSKL